MKLHVRFKQSTNRSMVLKEGAEMLMYAMAVRQTDKLRFFSEDLCLYRDLRIKLKNILSHIVPQKVGLRYDICHPILSTLRDRPLLKLVCGDYDFIVRIPFDDIELPANTDISIYHRTEVNEFLTACQALSSTYAMGLPSQELIDRPLHNTYLNLIQPNVTYIYCEGYIYIKVPEFIVEICEEHYPEALNFELDSDDYDYLEPESCSISKMVPW